MARTPRYRITGYTTAQRAGLRALLAAAEDAGPRDATQPWRRARPVATWEGGFWKAGAVVLDMRTLESLEGRGDVIKRAGQVVIAYDLTEQGEKRATELALLELHATKRASTG